MIAVTRERPWCWPGRRNAILTPVEPVPQPAVAVPTECLADGSIHSVAVCDDDILFIRYVERVLAEGAAETIPVTTLDPEEAVRVIATAACDAALIDLRMYNDDLAGLTLIRLLREQPSTRSMRLQMVSGATRDLKKYDELLREYGVSVLAKPFTPEELLASLGLTREGSAA